MFTRWEDMLEQEKVIYLLVNALGYEEIPVDLDLPSIDLNFVAQCEAKLNNAQMRTYVKYLSSDVALKTYAGLSDEEQVSAETADRFYFNFLTLPADLRAERLWNVLASYAP
jgi:hypothetical protein